jgi:hypothetical protein
LPVLAFCFVHCVLTHAALLPLNAPQFGRHEGFEGGLYADGKNTPHGAHAEALRRMCAAVQPLDAQGRPDPEGRIVVIGVGASVCRQIFEALEESGPSAVAKRPEVVFVNCARGGHDVNKISDPERRYWEYAKEAVTKAGFSPAQVQVAWYQSDDLRDTKDDFPGRPRRLQESIARNMRELKSHFPNTRLCYHSARHTTAFMPDDEGKAKHAEPRPWHVGWSVKWLIEAQSGGATGLKFDGPDAVAPLAAWATYFWTDADTPRADGYHWTRDMNVKDGVHLSAAGQTRVAGELLAFWRTNEFARMWFAGMRAPAPAEKPAAAAPAAEKPQVAAARALKPDEPALLINGKSKFAKLERLLGTKEPVRLVALDMTGKEVLAVADVFRQRVDLNERLGPGEFRLRFLGPDGKRIPMAKEVPEVVRLR